MRKSSIWLTISLYRSRDHCGRELSCLSVNLIIPESSKHGTLYEREDLENYWSSPESIRLIWLRSKHGTLYMMIHSMIIPKNSLIDLKMHQTWHVIYDDPLDDHPQKQFDWLEGAPNMARWMIVRIWKTIDGLLPGTRDTHVCVILLFYTNWLYDNSFEKND